MSDQLSAIEALLWASAANADARHGVPTLRVVVAGLEPAVAGAILAALGPADALVLGEAGDLRKHRHLVESFSPNVVLSDATVLRALKDLEANGGHAPVASTPPLAPSTNYYASSRVDYAVGYSDLFYNDHPEIWVKIGGSNTGGGTYHGTTSYNRYMQLTNPPYYNDGPAYWLYYATQDYLGNHPEITQVCTNDMALPKGGKFDICPLYPLPQGCTGFTPWTSPHASHDRGTAADVAGTGSTQCANAGGSGVNVDEFLNNCVLRGALAAYSINEGNHAHCQFDDPNSWPH